MQRWISVLAVLCFAGAGLAQPDTDELTPGQKALQDIVKELNGAQGVLVKEFRAAEDAQEKEAIRKKFFDLVEKTMPRVLQVAIDFPKDAAAEEALFMILRRPGNNPLGKKALDLILANHLDSPRLSQVCASLADDGAPGATALEAILAKSPHAGVQGAASLALGKNFIRQYETAWIAKDGKANEYADKARKILEQADAKFGDQTVGRGTLASAVKSALYQLDHLTVGKKAPEISGDDIEGQPLKLSDYSGKVVVVNFWASWCGPCRAMIPHEKELYARLKREPFAFLGVNHDQTEEKAKDFADREELPWKSWFDKGNKIGRAFQVTYLPTIFVLDAQGVIRYRDVRGKDLDEAVDTLLREMGK